MCLDVVYRGKQKEEALAKLPEEFPVWKVLAEKDGEHFTADRFTPVDFGELEAPYLGLIGDENVYEGGWHAFTNEGPASRYADPAIEDVVQCAAKKCHIREIGEQDDFGQVVVLSHITFPKKCGKAKK